MNQELLFQVKNWIVSKTTHSNIQSLEDLAFQISPFCSYKKSVDAETVFHELSKRNIFRESEDGSDSIKYSEKFKIKKESLEGQKQMKEISDKINKFIQEGDYIGASIEKVNLWLYNACYSLPKTSLKLKRSIKQFCVHTIGVDSKEIIKELMQRNIVSLKEGNVVCKDEMEEEQEEIQNPLKRKSQSWFIFQDCKKIKK
jgi:hypothetical protein